MIERLEGGIFGVQFQIAVEVVKVDPENIDSAPSRDLFLYVTVSL